MPTTVDLGKIKVVWRGAFSAGTSYEIDDVVSYDGSSYICTVANSDNAAPTNNTSKWDVMAAGAAPLTAAGQLLSHDGTNTEVLDPLGATVGDVVQKDVDGSLKFGPVQGTYKGIRPAKPVGFYYDDGTWGKWQHFGSGFYERGWLHIPQHTSNGNIDPSHPQGDTVPYRELSFPMMKPVPSYIGPDFMTSHTHVGGYHDTFGCILEDKSVVFSGDYTYLPTDSDNNYRKFMEAQFLGVPGDKMGMFPDGDYPVQIVHGCGSYYLLMKSGDVWSAGYNGYGQLGHNDTTDRRQFQKIKHIGSQFTVSGLSTHIVAIACSVGSHYSDSNWSSSSVYFLDVHGRLFGCGYNGEGRLGTGDTSNRSIPTLISGVSNVDRFGIAGHHAYQYCFAVTTTGECYSWGYNGQGNLGLGDTTNRTTPTLVSMQNVRKIYPGHYGYSSSYQYNMCWLINDAGEMYGTGYNGRGHLGVGDSTDRSSFTRVGSALFHTMSWTNHEYRYPRRAAIERETSLQARECQNSKGQLYTWGYNGYGGLLTGDTTDRQSPFLVTETSCQLAYDNYGTTNKLYSFDPTNIDYVWFSMGTSGSDCFMFMLQDTKTVSGKRTMWISDYALQSGQNYGWYLDENSRYRDGYDITQCEVDGPILAPATWNYEEDSIYKNKLEMWYSDNGSSTMNHFYLTSDDYIYANGYGEQGIFGGGSDEQIGRSPKRLFLAPGN